MLFSARVVPSPAAMCAQQVSNTEPGEQCGAVVALLGGTGRYQTKVTIEESGSLNSCIRIEHQRKQSVIPLSRRRAAVDTRQDALDFRAHRDIRQVPPTRSLEGKCHHQLQRILIFGVLRNQEPRKGIHRRQPCIAGRNCHARPQVM